MGCAVVLCGGGLPGGVSGWALGAWSLVCGAGAEDGLVVVGYIDCRGEGRRGLVLGWSDFVCNAFYEKGEGPLVMWVRS